MTYRSLLGLLGSLHTLTCCRAAELCVRSPTSSQAIAPSSCLAGANPDAAKEHIATSDLFSIAKASSFLDLIDWPDMIGYEEFCGPPKQRKPCLQHPLKDENRCIQALRELAIDSAVPKCGRISQGAECGPLKVCQQQCRSIMVECGPEIAVRLGWIADEDHNNVSNSVTHLGGRLVESLVKEKSVFSCVDEALAKLSNKDKLKSLFANQGSMVEAGWKYGGTNPGISDQEVWWKLGNLTAESLMSMCNDRTSFAAEGETCVLAGVVVNKSANAAECKGQEMQEKQPKPEPPSAIADFQPEEGDCMRDPEEKDRIIFPSPCLGNRSNAIEVAQHRHNLRTFAAEGLKSLPALAALIGPDGSPVVHPVLDESRCVKSMLEFVLDFAFPVCVKHTQKCSGAKICRSECRRVMQSCGPELPVRLGWLSEDKHSLFETLLMGWVGQDEALASCTRSAMELFNNVGYFDSKVKEKLGGVHTWDNLGELDADSLQGVCDTDRFLADRSTEVCVAAGVLVGNRVEASRGDCGIEALPGSVYVLDTEKSDVGSSPADQAVSAAEQNHLVVVWATVAIVMFKAIRLTKS